MKLLIKFEVGAENNDSFLELWSVSGSVSIATAEQNLAPEATETGKVLQPGDGWEDAGSLGDRASS